MSLSNLHENWEHGSYEDDRNYEIKLKEDGKTERG